MNINDEIDMENLKYEVNKLKEENQELQVEIDILKEQLTLTDVGCSKITVLVTYWIWQDSGHALMDDCKHTFKKVVEVEKLTDINELFTNVAKIEILK